MTENNQTENAPSPGTREFKKRRREAFLVVFIGVVFVALTWAEFQLTHFSQKLPFVHSIFFFGLVNFNIVLLLFLLFLIFRNVVKIFVERQGKLIGGSLKGKLVAAFVTFSLVPTLLMFLISVFYINSSFDKWFSVKMARVLKDSLEITNAYFINAKRENYHFAHEIARELDGMRGQDVDSRIKALRRRYSLDSVELYTSVVSRKVVALSEDENIPEIPRASVEFLQKGISQKVESSIVHHFGEGNLIRVIVPVSLSGPSGNRGSAVVVSTFIPLSLISKMDDIAAAYDDFRDINPLQYPLKSIYLVILVLMTLVIIFAAIWFGFHLARQLSTPLETLASAARSISKGHFTRVDLRSGSAEINQLVSSFNSMTTDLEKSESELTQANQSLRSTLHTLDEHTRYIEVVLSNVTTGVISLSPDGTIQTINRYAGKLLRMNRTKFIGKKIHEALPDEYKSAFEGLLETLRSYRVDSMQKELRLSIGGETVLLQITMTLLKDEQKNDLGMILVFDDLSILVNAQRAAAWREVARRIAHEIKNPLTPIRLSAQRLEKKFGMQISDPAFSTCIGTIIKQVDELRDLVNEFSSFARLPQSKPILGSLNATIEESLVLYRTGHKDIKFDFSADMNLPHFEFDPDQIKRVLSNLLENSIAAISDPTGEVAISTQYDSVLGIVRVVVRDSGSGIAPEVRDRIFEPYFSTKKQGTGLGLAIVKRIIDDHNGFIRAYENEFQGTKIVIELPVLKGVGGRPALSDERSERGIT